MPLVKKNILNVYTQKNFICKHSMDMAVRCKMATVPLDVKYDLTQIEKLLKRIRPPKATKALIM